MDHIAPRVYVVHNIQGPLQIHPLRFSASIPAKYTNTPKKTMQIFVIKLRIFLTLSQIDELALYLMA